MAKRSFIRFVEQELGTFPHFVIYAVLEWVLIVVLFMDGFLAFFANEFARFFELKIPCLLCTRIDHVLVHRSVGFYYNESICESHKKEVSCLAYCHNHKKLTDINKMCESCLLSFATEKSSDCHTYKSVVGIPRKDIELLVDNDQDHHVTLFGGRKDELVQNEKIGLHRCSCCGEPMKERSQVKAKDWSLASRAPTPSPRAPFLATSSPRAPFVATLSPRAPFVNLRYEEHRSMDLPRIRCRELKFPENESGLHVVEDDTNVSVLGKQSREDVKAGSVSLMTGAEDMHEGRTPNSGRANKFYGIPLTDSASASPMWATRFARKSPLERTETASESAEGNAPNESEGDLILQHLKGQVKLDRRSLMELYLELDEERSAADVAAKNAMAMITRLQAEKAAVQMEALQYQRMMEEQAEYDQEALQATTELLEERDEQVRNLEDEIHEYRIKFGAVREEEGVEGSEDEADEDCQDMHSQPLSSYAERPDEDHQDMHSQSLSSNAERPDEGHQDMHSQSLSSNAERPEHVSPTYSSVYGRINRDFQHNNNQSSPASDENREGTTNPFKLQKRPPFKLQKPRRAGYLGRLNNMARKPHFDLDDGLSPSHASSENVAHMNEGTGKLMKELLHLHERVKALEAEDESSSQNDCDREKLLTQIFDNLQKLHDIIVL